MAGRRDTDGRAGRKVTAFATGLVHPRQPYALPNGDVLVVESSGPPAPIHRPKDLIMGWIRGFAGAGAKGADSITLLPNADGDGKPELRTVQGREYGGKAVAAEAPYVLFRHCRHPAKYYTVPDQVLARRRNSLNHRPLRIRTVNRAT